MDESQQPRASPHHPMGPLTNKLTNKPVRCKSCGCEWGIRDLLLPAGIDPYNIIESSKPTIINCGLCGRTLE